MTAPSNEGASSRRSATRTLPSGRRRPLPPVHPIVALRVIDDAVELELPWQSRDHLWLGSGAAPLVDVTLPSQHISRRHASIHRRGSRVVVVDEQSKNGLYYRGKREPEFYIGAGDVFRVADKEILALDESLRGLRPFVQRVLGYGAHREVDRALASIATELPVVVVGPRGCDQERLARAVHEASPRRERQFVDVPRGTDPGVVRGAEGGTVLVNLRTVGRVTRAFVDELLREDASARAIIVAESLAVVEAGMGKERTRCARVVAAVPLAARSTDVPRIFDALLHEELGSEHVVAELGAENVDALMGYSWRDNVDGIRRVLSKVHARLESGSIMGAAAKLGVRHQSIRRTFEALGLTFEPDKPGRRS